MESAVPRQIQAQKGREQGQVAHNEGHHTTITQPQIDECRLDRQRVLEEEKRAVASGQCAVRGSGSCGLSYSL